MPPRPLALGRSLDPRDDPAKDKPFELPPHHLVTHAVAVGMTGSGKTGLCIGLVEEAIRSRVPVLLIDIKGDLANLGLAFERFDASLFAPWVDGDAARRDGKSENEVATELASRWRAGLAKWGLDEAAAAAFRAGYKLRIITPGTSAGEALHVLSPLERQNGLWDLDEEAAREALSAAISLVLRMVKREPDPTRGLEHVLLSHLAERRQRAGQRSGLEELLGDLREPPIERVGALAVDEFLKPKERAELAKDLNALIASPTFSAWQKGAPLDVGAWMRGDPTDARVPVTIVSVSHLDDEERALVLSLVLEQTLAWVRSLRGTTELRALVLFDEVFGFLPPHPANPPTKRPLLALLKQARAFGVGCVLATQNPIDLDYKALSNAGLWFVGRLSTDADRERVVEGLVGSDSAATGGGARLDAGELAAIIKALPARTFFVRNVHSSGASELLETRWTFSWLRGPMTRQELKKLAQTGRVERPDDDDAKPHDKPVPAPARPSPLSPLSPPSPGAASTAAFTARPNGPDGWRMLFPCPPDAETSAWFYAPHVAVVARAELSDARLGVRDVRTIALVAPVVGDAVDWSRATDFEPAVFHFEPVQDARFCAIDGALGSPRAVKAVEKALRERAFAAARVTVHGNPVLGLASSPGESLDAFVARCAEVARARATDERGATLTKYEARRRKLVVERDAARAALARAQGEEGPSFGDVVGAMAGLRGGLRRAQDRQDRAETRAEKARDKLAKADAELAELTAKRDGDVAARDAELAQAARATVTRELVAKKSALLVQGYAVVWVAS